MFLQNIKIFLLPAWFLFNYQYKLSLTKPDYDVSRKLHTLKHIKHAHA